MFEHAIDGRTDETDQHFAFEFRILRPARPIGLGGQRVRMAMIVIGRVAVLIGVADVFASTVLMIVMMMPVRIGHVCDGTPRLRACVPVRSDQTILILDPSVRMA